MQLRDHPLMVRKSGWANWPPLWTTTDHDKSNPAVGEVGILEHVLMSNIIDNKVYLLIEHGGVKFVGTMGFDDLQFCEQIYFLLRGKIGRSIKQIGDSEVSQLL